MKKKIWNQNQTKVYPKTLVKIRKIFLRKLFKYYLTLINEVYCLMYVIIKYIVSDGNRLN